MSYDTGPFVQILDLYLDSYRPFWHYVLFQSLGSMILCDNNVVINLHHNARWYYSSDRPSNWILTHRVQLPQFATKQI